MTQPAPAPPWTPVTCPCGSKQLVIPGLPAKCLGCGRAMGRWARKVRSTPGGAA